MTTPPPLAGRCIAVTRPAGNDGLAARLRELGASVLECPAVEIGPPGSLEALDRALRALEGVDWIAFASVNAVERTCARAAELGVTPAALARPRLAAVGAATAERVASRLRPPDLVPERASGEGLAAALAGAVQGRRVLLPRAEEGRPELAEGLARAGAEVVAPAAYRTVAVAPAALEPLAAALRAGDLDAVVFASPSAVRSVLAALDALGDGRELLGRAALAAIGPTTAAELRAHGREVAAEPPEPSVAALSAALVRALAPPPAA